MSPMSAAPTTYIQLLFFSLNQCAQNLAHTDITIRQSSAVLMFSCVTSGIEIQNAEPKERLPICRSGQSTEVALVMHEMQATG